LFWSQRYDRQLDDVFAIQDEIARTIVDTLRATWFADLAPAPVHHYTDNVRAYGLYLKGRYEWNRRTQEGVTAGIRYFEQAIAADPSYALAYTGLADCYALHIDYRSVPVDEGFAQAKKYALQAIALNDSLAEAHASLAFVNLYYDRDWAGAEHEFQRAIDLNPNYASGHHWYAEFLSVAGRHKQAISESERARELDPLSNIINTWVGSRYFFARQYDKALEQCRNAVEMGPNFAPARMVLGQAYEQKGMLQEAIAEFERALSLAGGSSVYAASLAHAFGVAGRSAEALKVLGDLRQMADRRFVSSYDLALVQVGLGDNVKAFELLTAAVQERSPRVVFLGVEPRFDGLRADPRFRELLRSVGLQL
jgi:serine/threonine-protein kinase